MNDKLLMYGPEARKKLLDGVKKISDAVGSTMGPRYRNCLIYTPNAPVISTNDGVTVARNITLKNKWEDAGCQLVREVALKTNDDCGDGTTTATVLAESILEKGLENLSTDVQVSEMKRGMDACVKDVVQVLKEKAIPVTTREQIKNIAKLSAQDEEIGEVIADVFDKLGKDSYVTVEDSHIPGVRSQITEGFKLPVGYVTPYLANDKTQCIINDCPVLVLDYELTNIMDIANFLVSQSNSGKNKLCIIARGFSNDVLMSLVANHVNKKFSFCLIKVNPHQKDLLQDVAVATGATLLSADTGRNLNSISASDLGFSRRVECGKEHTMFVEPQKTESLTTHLLKLKSEQETLKSEYEIETVKERIARLSSAVAVIYIGAASELERKSRKDKLEDALNAARAAIEEGILPGGGCALLKAEAYLDPIRETSESYKIGYKIIIEALSAPYNRILKNAGVISDNSYDISWEIGYDAGKLEECNLIERGIIDPCKVTRCALENAASAAGTLLLTETVIIPEPDDTNCKCNKQ